MPKNNIGHLLTKTNVILISICRNTFNSVDRGHSIICTFSEQDQLYNQVLQKLYKDIISDYYKDKEVLYQGNYYPVQYVDYYTLQSYITYNSYIELDINSAIVRTATNA